MPVEGLLGLDCEEGEGGAYMKDSHTTADEECFGRIRALGLTLEELIEDFLGG